MNYFLGLLSINLLAVVILADELGVVKITPSTKERFGREGDSLDVECSVTAKKTTQKLEWTKPSEIGVSKNQWATVKDDGDTMVYYNRLVISKLMPEHFGTYTCKHGSSSASFQLLAPTEDKVTANYTYGMDPKSVTLSCKLGGVASSKEITKVEWLKNYTLVTELEQHKRFKEIPDNHSLEISEPNRDDADLYIARFTFKDMDAPYDCAVPFTAAPLVMDFEKSKNLIEDDTMELRCNVKGYPRAVVTWTKNGNVLNASDAARVMQTSLNDYENARLVIKHVQFEDAGDYTCTAYSEYFNQSNSKTLIVRVKDKLAALWPFLGIVGEVVVLCFIIFIYEKRRNKQAENEANNAQDVDSSSLKKEGVRHRGQKK